MKKVRKRAEVPAFELKAGPVEFSDAALDVIARLLVEVHLLRLADKERRNLQASISIDSSRDRHSNAPNL